MKTLREVMMLENEDKGCPCCDSKEEDCTCDAGCKKCSCTKKKGANNKNVKESFTFDKFMDSILIRESRSVPKGDSPNRERAKRHQERPLNRIKFEGGSR
jgi:hypothetical protein